MMKDLLTLALTLLVPLALASPVAAQEGEEEGGAVIDLNADYASAARRAGRGDYSGAIRIFKEIIAQDPYWSDAVYNISTLAEHRSDWQDCALYSRRYLLLEPDDPSASSIDRRRARCEAAIGRAGTLHVTSTTPEGVTVLLDGLDLGSGSLGPLQLGAGTYTLTASRYDYFPWEEQVEVREGETTTLAVVLEIMPTFGTISLQVDEPGARVSIDGVDHGVTPLEDPIRLATGTYRLEIVKEGFHPWRRDVEILRDLDETIEIRLIDEDVDLSLY